MTNWTWPIEYIKRKNSIGPSKKDNSLLKICFMLYIKYISYKMCFLCFGLESYDYIFSTKEKPPCLSRNVTLPHMIVS